MQFNFSATKKLPFLAPSQVQKASISEDMLPAYSIYLYAVPAHANTPLFQQLLMTCKMAHNSAQLLPKRSCLLTHEDMN